MTTIKADIQAADRILTTAIRKTITLIRAGHTPADYLPLLDAAETSAGMLLERRSA